MYDLVHLRAENSVLVRKALGEIFLIDAERYQ